MKSYLGAFKYLSQIIVSEEFHLEEGFLIAIIDVHQNSSMIVYLQINLIDFIKRDVYVWQDANLHMHLYISKVIQTAIKYCI
jgi:hypothetical protein